MKSFSIIFWIDGCLFLGNLKAVIVPAVALPVSLISSFLGLWIFDLSVNQLVQENVPEYVRGSINGAWRSLYAFFDMSSFIAVLIFSDPSDFFILAMISFIMIGLATTTYTIGYILEHCSSNSNSNFSSSFDNKNEYEMIQEEKTWDNY